MKKDKLDGALIMVAKYFNIDYIEFKKLPWKEIKKYMDTFLFLRDIKSNKLQYFTAGALLFMCLFYIANFFFQLYVIL